MRQWVIDRHYLKSAPPGFAFVLEFTSDGQRIGAMIFGRPSSRELDAGRLLELTRMYFVDEAPKNTESQGLAKARALIRKWFPQIRLLLAYSDPAQGHKGTVYEADGWAPFGKTKHVSGYGWKSREGRRSEQCWPKQRWVRTP